MRPSMICLVVMTLAVLSGCSQAPVEHTASLAPDQSAPAPRKASQSAQPDYAEYRSPIQTRVLDRRFRTKEAMYLANEMNIGGEPFLLNAVQAGLPVGNDREFQYMTAIESYWYSRYNMSSLMTESRLGVHLVHGPYVTDKALRESVGADSRYRGERIVSNKTELIQRIIPAYLARTGLPRRFEDASPCMLQFASGDPHFPQEVDKGTDFESTDNKLANKQLRHLYGPGYEAPPSGMGEPGNDMWKYRVNYRENFLSLRWDHDKMEHEVDLGAEGQVLMKQVLWAEYFFRQLHHRGKYLGNNPEEGFRGAILNLAAVSKMLILKSAMLYDGDQLTGINPTEYDPNERLLYFPHRIGVRLRYVGDLPPRPEEFRVVDASSQLFDQASLLWGLSEYYYFADPTITDPWDSVFGETPPYDGSLMEQKYALLSQGLANVVLANIKHQHRADGRWASRWDPDSGSGSTVSTVDLGMTMVALANYCRHMHVEEEKTTESSQMLREQADFLIDQMQDADGQVASGYDHAGNQPVQDETATLVSQGFAIRGLLEAYRILEDEKYLDAANRVYAFMNDRLWDDESGVYRSSVDSEITVYTPMTVGAVLGAMREIILTTKDMDEVERFKRFFVQGVNSSGIQQAEYEETGESDLTQVDGDGDGIPRMEAAGGRHGIAPVYASEVEIETPVTQQVDATPPGQ